MIPSVRPRCLPTDHPSRPIRTILWIRTPTQAPRTLPFGPFPCPIFTVTYYLAAFCPSVLPLPIHSPHSHRPVHPPLPHFPFPYTSKRHYLRCRALIGRVDPGPAAHSHHRIHIPRMYTRFDIPSPALMSMSMYHYKIPHTMHICMCMYFYVTKPSFPFLLSSFFFRFPVSDSQPPRTFSRPRTSGRRRPWSLVVCFSAPHQPSKPGTT